MPDDDTETYEHCKYLLDRIDYPNEKIHIIKGWFEDTFPGYEDSIEKIAVLHVDCDWYESVKLSLETFYDKVVPGGVIIFDDYGFWKGAKKAIDEFLIDKDIILNEIDSTAVWFQK